MEFNKQMEGISDKALKCVDGFFDDKKGAKEKIKEALKVIGFKVSLKRMEEINERGNKSLALRLIKFLPQDKGIREKYILLTNPEVKPLLLDKPSKKK